MYLGMQKGKISRILQTSLDLQYVHTSCVIFYRTIFEVVLSKCSFLYVLVQIIIMYDRTRIVVLW